MRGGGHAPTIGADPPFARSDATIRPLAANPPPAPDTLLRIALATALMLVAGIVGYLASERYGAQALAERANNRLDVLIAEIDGIITSGSNLPSALVINEHVLSLLREPEAAAPEPANRFLEALNNHLGSLASFVLDRDGIVRASSDWGLSDNLIGRDLAHQPFFRMALNGSRYGYYAADSARNEPGFYFSQPILDEHQAWRIVGVAVVKISLADLQRRWLTHESPVLAADREGVVILSTVPEWRYTLLNPERAELLAESRRFDGRTLRPFPVRLDGVGSGIGRRVLFSPAPVTDTPGALPPERDYFALGRTLAGTSWQLVIFAEYGSVRRQALTTGALAAVLAGALLLLSLYVAQRRRLARLQREAQRLLQAANQDLESKVAARTADLTAVNVRLRQEIAERIRAEETLRAAQDELVQAAKLAVLGRLAAGITHELNQPLGAVRTLAANAVAFMRRGDLATAESNLEIVARQVDQMARIIGPLKTFARKSPARREPVDIAHAVGAALFLFAKRLDEAGIVVDNRCHAGETIALCDANRLEQVLVNLVGNAIDALKDAPRRTLTLTARRDGAHVVVTVADSGPGLTAAACGHLFEPFFTTKSAGEGLGLGLAISRDIVRDFGGDLDGGNGAEGGAVFTVTLPAAKETP